MFIFRILEFSCICVQFFDINIRWYYLLVFDRFFCYDFLCAGNKENDNSYLVELEGRIFVLI